MADDNEAPIEGYWLDIQVPRRVHRQLSAWGRRLGLTPEGYAKLLIYQGMHPLLAEEVSKRAHVARFTRGGKTVAQDEAKIAEGMWLEMLRQYEDAPDLLPAPREVSGESRLYAAEDFRWPDGKYPPAPFARWDGKTLTLGAENPNGRRS